VADKVDIVASWGAASSAPTVADALKWCAGLRWRSGCAVPPLQLRFSLALTSLPCAVRMWRVWRIIGATVTEYTPAVARYVNGEIEKFEPISEGTTTKRKRKPHIVAVINEMCTGCSGSPACVEYCPVADCMFWVPDSDHPPFGRILVDPLLCIGCKLCTSKGPDGSFLEGCPWDAIDMVPLAEFEGKYGVMPF